MLVKKLVLQLRPHVSTIAAYYTLSLSLLIFTLLLGNHWHWPIDRFTRDPAAILNTHPFTGIVSNVGALIWCSTVAICLFSAILISKKDRTTAKFLFSSGLLTLMLLIDDMFMFHDYIFPVHFNLSEKLVYLFYIAIVGVYFTVFARQILKTDYLILLIASGFMAMSVLCDSLFMNEGMEFLLEDGLKLFGIVTWFMYFSRTCLSMLQKESYNRQD